MPGRLALDRSALHVQPMPRRNIPGCSRLKQLQAVRPRKILYRHKVDCSFWLVPRRIFFRWWRQHRIMYTMSTGHFQCSWRSFGVHCLCYRVFSEPNGSRRMLALRPRCILQQHRPCCSQRPLLSRIVLLWWRHFVRVHALPRRQILRSFRPCAIQRRLPCRLFFNWSCFIRCLHSVPTRLREFLSRSTRMPAVPCRKALLVSRSHGCEWKLPVGLFLRRQCLHCQLHYLSTRKIL